MKQFPTLAKTIMIGTKKFKLSINIKKTEPVRAIANPTINEILNPNF